MVGTYTYDAYGKQISTTGGINNNFRYGGKYGYYYDEQVYGMYLAGARWYAPDLYRWMSRDPIEYAGGDNMFAYVAGNPVKYVDPSGLAKCVYSISKHKLVCTSSDGMNTETLGPDGVVSGYNECENTPSCADHINKGPIPPGEYQINKDVRDGHEGRWRLEPVPKIPGIICKSGIKRCGFQLHKGTISLGCITALTSNPTATADYDNIDKMLNNENGSNTLTVEN